MNLNELISKPQLISQAINELYLEPEPQINRYQKALESFRQYFNTQEIHILSVPGRVELCGNHTDHQLGKVLAGAINLDAVAVVSKCDKIHIYSDGYAKLSVEINDLAYNCSEDFSTKALLKGVLKRFSMLGYQIGGFNAYITSDVLSGSGMSSSANIEMLFAAILNKLYNNNQIDIITLAQISQYAEVHYFNKPCGLMDQLACGYGGVISIDFKNIGQPAVEQISSTALEKDYAILLVRTPSSHQDLSEEYGLIVTEMRLIAQHFQHSVLSEVNPAEFYQTLSQLTQLNNDRAILRAHHFFQENLRVDDAVQALKTDDINHFMKVLTASGYSSSMYLQNIFAVSQYKNQKLGLALAMTETYLMKTSGAFRVHGGGLGGTILVVMSRNAAPAYQDYIESIFGAGSCLVLNIRHKGSVCVI